MKKHLAIVIGLVFLVLILAVFYNTFHFKMVSSSPTNNIYPAGSTEIALFFNKVLANNTGEDVFVVTTNPQQSTSIKIDNKVMRILFRRKHQHVIFP